MKRIAPPTQHRERGAALLTAMIIVTLVATLSAAMVWQQWRAVQIESAERARLQSAWILNGALDWAKLILREDAKASAQVDHLGEPWAVPLAEARLSTFLAVDKNNADDAPEAFLSGSITDAQSRYNLRNLIDQNAIVPAELEGLKRLFQAINVAPDLAVTIAEGLRGALAPPDSNNKSANAPLMPQSIEQLAWLGIDAESVQKMEAYVVLLPERTAVNVNTAPKEVLVAAIDNLDLGTAERMVQTRQRQPFKTLDDIKAVLPATTAQSLSQARAFVVSKFFEVRGRLRLEDRVLEESSLVERRGIDIIPLSRRREMSREALSG
ncbi:type II secretion system minor pseudopilin GspK [Piscinibacter sp. XHJ-5]|uniref:type II secretion system minor pseudopilin GspK n=1 Tax=Piscinibacter sp. XHJ-5 TaxID=3037797 RepID=UPI0024533535|nr:type II secretion system minor pseudopilin GspK [Piscinibacter sp. XHJ-5]